MVYWNAMEITVSSSPSTALVSTLVSVYVHLNTFDIASKILNFSYEACTFM